MFIQIVLCVLRLFSSAVLIVIQIDVFPLAYELIHHKSYCWSQTVQNNVSALGIDEFTYAIKFQDIMYTEAQLSHVGQ